MIADTLIWVNPCVRNMRRRLSSWTQRSGEPLSVSPTNFHVYTTHLKPHERIKALDLPHDGHLSYGYQICNKQKAILLTNMAHISGLTASGHHISGLVASGHQPPGTRIMKRRDGRRIFST
ncbi:unnamed protein product [Urochloa humidicola]